jgi:hypothetical protein
VDAFSHTFALLKKAVIENKRIKDLYLDTFSVFEYTYFLNDLLGEEKRDWNWTPSDASKEILEKNLISIFAPLKEFEIRVPEGPFMEFLPDLKFALSYKKGCKDLRFRFSSNGYVTFTCQEKEALYENSIFTTYCPRENFYNLLSIMTLIMTAAVYDKKNLSLIKQNFQAGCFYFSLVERIEEKLPEIRKIYQALEKKITSNFYWKQEKMFFMDIVNPLDAKDLYSVENFPKKGFITRYSFCINEYKKELEFNFKELEEIKKKKCFYRDLSREINLKMPEFIGIYPNGNKLYPYKVFLRYNYIKEKLKEEVVLRYSIKSKKLELDKNQNVSEELKKGISIFITRELTQSFIEKVGKNLFDFCNAAKTKEEDTFSPIGDYFSIMRKILLGACKVALLISKF